MRIAVLGTGYVGLVAGTCLADTGHTVTGIDIDPGKVERLGRGDIPIYEPGLSDLVHRNVAEGRLAFTTEVTSVADAEVVFIAVQTPQDEDGSADLSHVLEATRQLLAHCGEEVVLVLKSTVPVGTADRVKAVVREVRGESSRVEVVSNPEFLKEGAAVQDFLHPDRVVIGTESPRARAVMADIYEPFVRTERPILFMDHRSAEITKYASNALLAARVSFMNDIARLCDAVGADVDLVRKGMGADQRIGYPFLFPGAGYGGSCFPKDVQALMHTARTHGLDFGILEGTEKTNALMKLDLFAKADAHFRSDLAGRTFAVWGLAFKPRTDDVREASSLALIRALVNAGATVRANDPEAAENARRALGDLGDAVSFHDLAYECLEGADALFVVTEWNEYRRPDFDRVKALLRQPVVFDGRNVYDPARLRERGFTYFGIGRR